jgi:hypothetical protein
VCAHTYIRPKRKSGMSSYRLINVESRASVTKELLSETGHGMHFEVDDAETPERMNGQGCRNEGGRMHFRIEALLVFEMQCSFDLLSTP